jgi:hypothetical protein
MKHGSLLIVSSGMSEFRCWFLAYADEQDKLVCMNRMGRQIVISMCDIVEFYV